jgi:hypothetical protein
MAVAKSPKSTYVLHSNIADWNGEQLWKAYIQLAQAEVPFRIQKDQLQVRPIWHQRADDPPAHLTHTLDELQSALRRYRSTTRVNQSPPGSPK